MASEIRCSKPGCGARKIVGKPCTDADCPQQWVHHTDYTPVAPVSPDATGKCGELVTVGEVSTVRESVAAFAGHMLSRQLKPGDLLCLRSQAVELLAAERAKYRDAMEKLVESQRETLVWQQRAIDLKADNAALSARVEELIGANIAVARRQEELANQLAKTKDDFEAKLAAAEKALEPFANAADGRKSKSVTGSVCFSQHYLLAARAALGGKTS